MALRLFPNALREVILKQSAPRTFLSFERSDPQMKCSSSEAVFVPQSSLLSNLLRDVLHNGSHCRFQTTGYSMSPFIKGGDVITISPLLSSLGIGDVVAFIHPVTSRLAIHRVVGRKGDSYLIKGDNTHDTDGLVHKAKILGYITGVERNGRSVSLGLGPERFLIAFINRTGLFSLLLFPIWRIIRPIFRFK